MTSRASASAVAAPPMSFFISSMPDAGLMSRPPVSKVTPLPISATFGASSRPQEKSTIRGSSAAARPTAWMSGKLAARSSSPRTMADAGVELLGELDGLLLERAAARAHWRAC